MTPEQIAPICHEANRALQRAQADPSIAISPSWDDLDQETRASCIDGVAMAQSWATPEEMHQNWCRFKFAHDWAFGPIKDDARKEHPLLVPYDDLPADQQAKDHLFSAIVHALSV